MRQLGAKIHAIPGGQLLVAAGKRHLHLAAQHPHQFLARMAGRRWPIAEFRWRVQHKGLHLLAGHVRRQYFHPPANVARALDAQALVGAGQAEFARLGVRAEQLRHIHRQGARQLERAGDRRRGQPALHFGHITFGQPAALGQLLQAQAVLLAQQLQARAHVGSLPLVC